MPMIHQLWFMQAVLLQTKSNYIKCIPDCNVILNAPSNWSFDGIVGGGVVVIFLKTDSTLCK